MLKITLEKKIYEVSYCDKKTGEELAKFYGSPLTPEEMSKILKKHTITKWEGPKREQKQRVQDFNHIEMTKDRILGTITGWSEDIVDDDGNPIRFSQENLIKMWLNHTAIINDVMDQFDEIAKGDAEETEEERKNSENS